MAGPFHKPCSVNPTGGVLHHFVPVLMMLTLISWLRAAFTVKVPFISFLIQSDGDSLILSGYTVDTQQSLA